MVMESIVEMSSQGLEETHSSSDIEAGNESILWADSINKKLSQRSNLCLGPTSCIYRVQQRIRQVNRNAYTPDTVSIGPYHRVNKNLKAMKNPKFECVQAVLDRDTTSLVEYVEALKKLEHEARGCYAEPINLSREQFVEMMLVDGLFIIELFRINFGDVLLDGNDLVFNFKSSAGSVVRDLILLENQIPMLILQKLFDMGKNHNADASVTLIDMTLSYFDMLIPDAMVKYPGSRDENKVTHKHLVDLLSYTLCNSLLPASRKSESSTAQESLPCVVELRRSGVKFKKRLKCDSLIDIKFDKGKGVFEIPPIHVDDFTDSFFRNLIAYEQCRFHGTPYITSYAIVMSYLINSADDVAILRQCEIITNQLGDDNKVSSLFNDLCSGICSNGFYYCELCEEVNDYYKDKYHNWKATFNRKYCSSPWSAISVLAATLALFLTLWAAVFSALPVFKVSA